MYCRDLDEYKRLIDVLDKSIIDYKEMTGDPYQFASEFPQKRLEESVKFDKDRITWLRCTEKGCTEAECNIDMQGNPKCEQHFKG